MFLDHRSRKNLGQYIRDLLCSRKPRPVDGDYLFNHNRQMVAIYIWKIKCIEYPHRRALESNLFVLFVYSCNL